MTGPAWTVEVEALVASWPACDYWSSGASLQLWHASVVQALTHDVASEAELRQRSSAGRTLYGWTRRVVSDDDIENMIIHLTSAFHDFWASGLGLGNPMDDDDDDEPEWLRPAVTADMRKRHVWCCEQTHVITLTLAQILAVARWARPELFGGPT